MDRNQKSYAHRNMQMFPQQVIGLLCPRVCFQEATRQKITADAT